MSNRPKRCPARSTTFCESNRLLMSACTPTTVEPVAVISFSTRRSASSPRPVKTTAAPAAANRWTVASPRPRVPPVTTAHLPANDNRSACEVGSGIVNNGVFTTGSLYQMSHAPHPG
jgi:hypothetical protein